MLDLKPYYDAVVTADAELKTVASNIDTLFRTGTDEAKDQALALRPALEEAIGKYDRAEQLYDSLKKANLVSNVAANFVPVSPTNPAPEDPSSGAMKRADFMALTPAARAEHIKCGGTVED